jgi:hypothetical protein
MNRTTGEAKRLDASRLVASFGLIAALAMAGEAAAQTTGSIPTSRCASLGPGFVPVAGSSACVRIGGHVRVDGGALSAIPGGAASGMRHVSEHSYIRAPSGWTGLYKR